MTTHTLVPAQRRDTMLPFQQRMALAEVMWKSGYFNDAASASQAMVRIQAGAELGIPPFAAMSAVSELFQTPPAVSEVIDAELTP